MTIYELRTYDIAIGRMPEYLATFATRGLPVLSRYAVPTGFWVSGAMETGPLNQVNHIWRYEGVADRIARREALYADPDWVEGFVPASAGTMNRLESRLMVLDQGYADTLAVALADDRRKGRVVATFAPDAGRRFHAAGIGAWRFVTGEAGSGFTLDYLIDTDLETTDPPPGCRRHIWNPAPFSAIK